MSVASLPALIKQIYSQSRYNNHIHHNPSIINLLNRYQGKDWMEHMTYSLANDNTSSFALYNDDVLSLNLIGVSNQSKFFFNNKLTYHVKVLNGKMKMFPNSCTLCSENQTETFSALDFNNENEKWWLENSFVDHSSALVVSSKITRIL